MHVSFIVALVSTWLASLSDSRQASPGKRSVGRAGGSGTSVCITREPIDAVEIGRQGADPFDGSRLRSSRALPPPLGYSGVAPAIMRPKTLKIVLVIIGIVYVLFPRDLVPDRLGRGFGYIDDVLVAALLWYIYRRVMRRQRGQAGAPGAASAEGGRGPGPGPASNDDPRSAPRENARPPPHSRAGPSAAPPPRSGSSRSARSSPSSRDPYTVLGISPSATQEEIRKAYRARMVEYHPDRVNHLGEELREVAHKKTLEIQRAYAKLKR